MQLTAEERAVLSGETGTPGAQMAMELVAQAGRMLGAQRLIPVTSAHIDGCLYHGRSGTLYAEALAERGARVSVPATTNVGALNLLKPDQCRLQGEARQMAYRLMVAHERMGCTPSWTCAPYQAGARPGLGSQVAWGESNAVAFVNPDFPSSGVI
jgi:predicted aconitase